MTTTPHQNNNRTSQFANDRAPFVQLRRSLTDAAYQPTSTFSNTSPVRRHTLLLTLLTLTLLLTLLPTPAAHAHHFKGMPHFSYFENYPQVPQDEFLAQVDEYEMSLVIYDFQGINKIDAQQPDNVRFYLAIFNLLENTTYQGPLTIDILDSNAPGDPGDPILSRRFEQSEEESLYSFHRNLPDSGRYSLRVTLHKDARGKTIDEGDPNPNGIAFIPFTLSSQRTSWGPIVAGFLFLLITVAAIGSRKARVAMDRKENAKLEKHDTQAAASPTASPTEATP